MLALLLHEKARLYWGKGELLTLHGQIVILVSCLSSCHGPKGALCSDIYEGFGFSSKITFNY